MTPHRAKPILTMLSLFMLAGCSDVIKEFRDPPGLSPVGEGLNRKDLHPPLAQYQPQPYKSYQSMWDQSRTEFFKEPRAKSVGDVLTVSIDISDEANLDNESGRSRSSNNDFGMDLGFGLFGMNEEGEGDLDISSNSGSNGKGAINRSENINLQVAAIVTQRLPNGNMVISGSQEVRVNFEVRVLSVEGIVRPRDIGPNNVITYDKIAEARISYGNAGVSVKFRSQLGPADLPNFDAILEQSKSFFENRLSEKPLKMSDPVSPSLSSSSVSSSGNDRRLFINIFILTMLTAGAGAFAGMNLVDQTRLAVLKTERVQAKINVKPLYHAASYAKSIKPVVANLAEPRNVFVRVQGTVIFPKDAMEEASVLTSKIESDISAYIRTLTLADLEGAGGLVNLREDLNQRAKIRSKGKINEFILETMVVQ